MPFVRFCYQMTVIRIKTQLLIDSDVTRHARGAALKWPFPRCIIAMGLDKQPTPPPKRVREDTGGDSNIILKAPPKAQKTVNREDNLLQEPSQPEDVETPVREERVAVRAKAREGERRTQQTTAERCCSAVIQQVSLHRL